MHRIAAIRMAVPDSAAASFEKQIEEQLRRVRENEPGTTLYGFVRRDSAGSTLLPAVRPNATEYFHFMAFADEAGWDSHFSQEQEWWVPTFRSAIDAPLVSEGFSQDDVVSVISRDHVWTPASVVRMAVFRFKVSHDRASEFEREAKHQVEMVTENEPGTILYGFLRRKQAASGLLQRPLDGQAEYLHYMAYDSDEAQALHREIEFRPEGWAWGRVFRDFLVAPLEVETFPAGSIVSAVSRDKQWNE